MKHIEFNVYINVVGELYTEEDITTADDLTDAIFNDDADCEIFGIVTDPNHMPSGYTDIKEVDEEDE